MISKRLTAQKNLLQQEVENSSTLFDADRLHAKVIAKNPAIGMATVYRFLRDCVEEGKLHSYSCDRKTIYSTSKNSHAHFRCEKCGLREHLALKKLDFLPAALRNAVCHLQIDVTGICSACQAKSK